MSASCGSTARMIPHDGLSSGALIVIDLGDWRKNKMMTHPKRAPDNAILLALEGEAFLSRAIMEVENSFLHREEDMPFAEDRKEASVSLPN